ncbi:hypothetical protein JL722_14638 [Aureococcus anophagefferens]|nr:hypothetical protein JL722_14638 [Aureococcus anophagefferens]
MFALARVLGLAALTTMTSAAPIITITTRPTTVYSTNLLEEPVAVANVINTPTVMHGGDKVIYMTGTTRFNINGTAFRAKAMALTFEPPLVKDVDYILQVRSSTCMQLTLRSNRKWRSDGDPGALKLRRIDTGASALRIDAKYGGVTVAEVQVDLGAHGVTVESAPETKVYQGDGKLDILGSGFNTSAGLNTLKWGNSLRGKGINYTITSASKSQLSLADARLQVVYQTHTHELWITGTGFTRGAYSTRVDFDPPLLFGVDYVMMVFNRTHALVSLMGGRKWAPGTGILRVIGIDTGAGAYKDFKPVAVAHVAVDADDHPSGLTVTRTASQILYQTAAIRKLLIQGSNFCARPSSRSSRPGAQQRLQDHARAGGQLTLSLQKHKKWRYEAGPLYLTALKCGSDAIELAYGQGIVVATVLADPTIEMSERKIYATHTKRLIVQGSGFSLDGTELTLRPTSRASYEVESVEMAEMVLLLKDGKSWAPLGESSSPVSVYVTKVDTGAGEVVMEDDGAVIARVYRTPGSRTSSTRATSSFELLAPPSAEDELEMAKSAGRAAVPITPDVAYTGK